MTADPYAGFAAACTAKTLTDPEADAWLLQVTAPKTSCPHVPTCPAAGAVDHDAARIVASHPEQGWFLRCNGVISFTDCGDLIPDDSPCGCHIEQPHRGPAPHNPKES